MTEFVDQIVLSLREGRLTVVKPLAEYPGAAYEKKSDEIFVQPLCP